MSKRNNKSHIHKALDAIMKKDKSDYSYSRTYHPDYTNHSDWWFAYSTIGSFGGSEREVWYCRHCGREAICSSLAGLRTGEPADKIKKACKCGGWAREKEAEINEL